MTLAVLCGNRTEDGSDTAVADDAHQARTGGVHGSGQHLIGGNGLVTDDCGVPAALLDDQSHGAGANSKIKQRNQKVKAGALS